MSGGRTAARPRESDMPVTTQATRATTSSPAAPGPSVATYGSSARGRRWRARRRTLGPRGSLHQGVADWWGHALAHAVRRVMRAHSLMAHSAVVALTHAFRVVRPFAAQDQAPRADEEADRLYETACHRLDGSSRTRWLVTQRRRASLWPVYST